MTGEITLRGRVLPIGGLKSKLLAAHLAGVKTVLIPRRNEKDLVDVPEEVREQLRIVPVENMDQVLAEALIDAPRSAARIKAEREERQQRVTRRPRRPRKPAKTRRRSPPRATRRPTSRRQDSRPEPTLRGTRRAPAARDRWTTRTTTRSSASRKRPPRPRSRRPIASSPASSIPIRTRTRTPRSASRTPTRRMPSCPIRRSASSTTSWAPTGRPTSRPGTAPAGRPTGRGFGGAPGGTRWTYRTTSAEDLGGFSDFFRVFFGARPRRRAAPAEPSAAGSRAARQALRRRLRVRGPVGPRRAAPATDPGPAAQATAEVTLAEVANGTERMVNVERPAAAR